MTPDDSAPDHGLFTLACAWCGRVRRRAGWRRPDPSGESALRAAPVSHGICPRCLRAMSRTAGVAAR